MNTYPNTKQRSDRHANPLRHQRNNVANKTEYNKSGNIEWHANHKEHDGAKNQIQSYLHWQL